MGTPVEASDLLGDLIAVFDRHHHIENDKIVGADAELADAFRAVLGPRGVVSFAGEKIGEKLAEVRVVLAKQDVKLLFHAEVFWRGKIKVNVLPSPGDDTTSISAPCCCITAFT